MAAMSETDLTRMLLGLYECAVAPDKYPRLAHEIEQLFTDMPDESMLEVIEAHSGAIWDKAADLLFPNPEDPLARDRILEVTVPPDGDPDWTALLDRLPADDVTRLSALAGAGGPRRDILLRVATPDDDRFAFHLARRRGDRVQVYRLKNDISEEAEALLVSQFQITRSELHVLRGLVSGRALKDLAADSGKSIETIRSQTKSIAAKLGFSRQNEISAAVQSIARVSAADRAAHRPRDLDTLTLRDGRQMTVGRRGHPTGRPVLFFHDFSSSCHWPDSVAAQFADAGLQVISPSRAGFGYSDVNPNTTMARFEDNIADYAEVMDQLGLSDCLMLAFGTGFGLAHSLCRREPGRARFLVGLNVYPPILTRRDAMLFPPGMYRAGSLAALYAPRTCALISRYASRRAAAARSIEDMDQLTGMAGTYGDREARFFSDFIQPNLADVMMGKADGVWRDCTCLTIPWTDLYRRATPVRAMILQNADFPFQPVERTRDLAEEVSLPFEVLPRPYRHFVDVFDDVLTRLTEAAEPERA